MKNSRKRKFTDYKNELKNIAVYDISEYKLLSSSRIKRDFFLTNAVDLGQKLLGKIIVRKIDDEIVKCRIVETEAYMGEEDKACHAYNKRKTERTKPFWNPGGHLYVYIIYGVNHCMNIIANDEHTPQGCLIRAVEPMEGLDKVITNRGYNINTFKKSSQSQLSNLTNGPGKTAASLCINKTHNDVDLCSSDEIFLIDDPEFTYSLETSPRVNVDYAEDYKDKLWRFYIKDNKFVSKAKFKK